MKFFQALIAFVFFFNIGCAQVPQDRPHLSNERFDKRVTELIDFSVPVISVQELHENQSDYIILDAREKEEFDISVLLCWL